MTRTYPQGHGLEGGKASGHARKQKAAARYMALAAGMTPWEAFKAGFLKGYQVCHYNAVVRAKKRRAARTQEAA